MDLAIELENELSDHLDKGYCTIPEWRDYWWEQRARALNRIIAIQKEIDILNAYVNRCTERLER